MSTPDALQHDINSILLYYDYNALLILKPSIARYKLPERLLLLVEVQLCDVND